MDFEAGYLLGGKYRIVRRIGVGGMGSVYEAQHAGLGTPVAIKVLLQQLAKVPTVADRFRREAQVSATLKSPHVIQVTDVDQLPDGRPYLVMELLEGESLQDHLEKQKTLSREEAVDLGLQILLGLECAHALGVVHRDLKPGNVFLDTRGVGRVAKLLDFGVAKVKATPEFQALTRPGMVMGTPEYMAPEQAFSADQADARSDLYSVGVMLYEMLSGALPAQGSLPIAVAHQVMTNKVRPLRERCPGLPEGLLNLVHRAMQPERNSRFSTALEMRRALSAFAGELSLAGRVAASVSLGVRPVQVSAGSSGTEKVVAMPLAVGGEPAPGGGASAGHGSGVVAAGEPDGRTTGEMSRFRSLPTRPEPVAPELEPAKAASPAAPPAAASPQPDRAPRPGARPFSRTAEMPELAGRVPATLPTPDRPPPLEPQRRSAARSLVIGLLCLGALAGAGIGVFWLLVEAGIVEIYPDPGPPPPMPKPAPGYKPPLGTRPADKP
ncbi:MAG TPA: serine/threonine-protein kinase [Polyangiaceae bacterium]|nr:serine/threonine-protein kinase [Polyangiaceae bacterium]